jgi:hypothetical protein
MSRSSHLVFVGLLASFLALFSLTAVFVVSSAPTQRASAQQTSGLTISLTAQPTKAKVGDFVGFKAVVENTGDMIVSNLLINLNIPDALDARAINCPGDNGGSTTFCTITNFAPGSIAEVFFTVQVGTKANNGPVTVSASGDSIVLATASVPAIKIVGPKNG